ncbi:MAG: GAF domain-containing sensor histidine kinase [Actinomycetota bacterium]
MDPRDKLIQAGLTLSSELSLEAVLRRITELAVEIADARYGALGVIGRGVGLSEFVTVGMTSEERAAIGNPPEGRGLLGLLITEGKPMRISPISAHPKSVGFPRNHPQMTSLLGAPIVSRGRVFGSIYLADKRNAYEFSSEDEEAILVLAAQAGVAIENARLYEEAQRRERWLDAVREVATAILSRAKPDEGLALIARRARELVEADMATVSIPIAETQQLSVRIAEGAHAEELRDVTFPIEGSISGEVVRKGRAIVVEDLTTDPRAYQPIVETGEMGPAVLVPLSSHGRAFGTLLVANLRGGRTFADDEVRLLETFADQAGLALEYGRAQLDVQRLAVLEDRERIAKELHDGVIQSLFAVGMDLQGTVLASGDEDLSRRIERAVAELDRVIRDLRNYIFGLRPGILADRQLDQALRHLGEEFQRGSGVVTIVDVDPGTAAELAPRASDLIQLARESLSNVGRHANASTCRMALYRKGESAVLEIDDDGKGFDPSTTQRGDGLTNLENRAEALGGKVSIESYPAQGTTVRVIVPV